MLQVSTSRPNPRNRGLPIRVRSSNGVLVMIREATVMRLLAKRIMPLSVVACVGLANCSSIHSQRQPNLTIESRLQVAEAADAAGNSDLAISMYTAAAASEPSNISLQLRCADVLARNGKVVQARQILTERLGSNPHQ